MRLARLLAVARKETIQIRRDPRSLGMAFLMPMMLLFLYGYALTLDVDHVPAVVYDQDDSAESRSLLTQITQSGYFTVVATARSLHTVESALERGQAKVGLVIPVRFARDLDLGRRVPIQALLDGSDSNTATLAQAYLEAIVGRYSAQRASAPGGGAPPTPAVEARLRVWYNPDMRSTYYIVPGLIAVIMMVIAALLTSLTVAREWERGTMEQLVATPLRVPELVLGKLLPYFGIGLIDVGLATLVGTRVFGVPLRGSPTLLLALSVVFLLGTMSLGILISIKARSQVLASQVALTVTFLPAFLLSGFVFDINNLPPPLRAVTYVVPARYFVTILKGVFLKGVGARHLAPEIAFLTAFALMMVALAVYSFRKRLE